jgi:glycosyltransferase involved in cell wall biosynthesis
VFAGFNIPSTVIPNIVDVDVFRFRDRAPLRPRLLSTRNFESLYNVACTLRAFSAVQKKFPEATLTLVGSGSQERALKQLASELRLQNVVFVGRVAPSDIWRYYAEADIYLQTPDIDNMPSSVLEAFASGCAVVSTMAGGVPAILTDGVHGTLVPCGDAAAAAEAIVRLLNEPELSTRLTTAARKSCEQYRWSNVRAQWISLYRGLLRSDNAAVHVPSESQV